ncbi:Gamma-butyrobetaine dioxygenase [Halomonas sp. THAF12]|uniref:TauD/TfdA family dioxygenase n=1 Tax=Halomonas sp. THAF12 TaxID=2587849 RepID=UPI0012A7D9A3|nr:TauD/TfdA family dioxygenase [Halomonas sp. THAF12]QFT83941.1 Gamma-butyrobetaine dioxygenase [Halomonas sp. THAF12]
MHEKVQQAVSPAVERYTVTGLEQQDRDLVVHWGDGHTSRFNALWLRDNCSSGGDKLSAIRSFSLADVDPALSIADARLTSAGDIEIIWTPEAHQSTFSATWLRAHCYEPASRQARKRRPRRWNRAERQDNWPSVDFGDVRTSRAGHLALLETVADHGFALVNNVPATAEGTEELASYIAYIRETDFGRIFDIVSEPNVWDLSQSDQPLHPHTDDPYRYSPPGISMLHCLQASESEGGTSQIVDGFAVCEALRRQDPAAFDLLAATPMPFVRYREDPVPQGADVHLRAMAPIIKLDRDGEVCGFRFHERSIAPLDMAPEVMDSVYHALIKLATLVYSEEFMVNRHLAPGQAIVFDNQRVLHGRTGFEGLTQRRHLRICTTDRDQFHSRLRLLLSREGREGTHFEFPNGAV